MSLTVRELFNTVILTMCVVAIALFLMKSKTNVDSEITFTELNNYSTCAGVYMGMNNPKYTTKASKLVAIVTLKTNGKEEFKDIIADYINEGYTTVLTTNSEKEIDHVVDVITKCDEYTRNYQLVYNETVKSILGLK